MELSLAGIKVNIPAYKAGIFTLYKNICSYSFLKPSSKAWLLPGIYGGVNLLTRRLLKILLDLYCGFTCRLALMRKSGNIGPGHGLLSIIPAVLRSALWASITCAA